MSMLPRPPYGIPAFVPPMFPGGLPRGFLRGALTHSPGQLEAPILEEVVAGKKKGIPLRKTTNSEIVSYKARVGMPKLLHIDCANS